jgi:hypothetical protein
MTIAELLAATGLTANDLVPIYDAEAAQNVEPTQKVTAAQLAAAVKVLASLVNTTEMSAAIQQSTATKEPLLVVEDASATLSTSLYDGYYYADIQPTNTINRLLTAFVTSSASNTSAFVTRAGSYIRVWGKTSGGNVSIRMTFLGRNW